MKHMDKVNSLVIDWLCHTFPSYETFICHQKTCTSVMSVQLECKSMHKHCGLIKQKGFFETARALDIISLNASLSLFLSLSICLFLASHFVHQVCCAQQKKHMWNNSVSFPQLLSGSHSWKHVIINSLVFFCFFANGAWIHWVFLEQPFLRCIIFVWAMLPAVGIMQVLTGFFKCKIIEHS